MNKIKYIAHYIPTKNENKTREGSLAAINKVDYIVEALVKSGYKVELISVSGSMTPKFLKAEILQLSEHVSLRLFTSLGWGPSKFKKFLSLIFMRLNVFIFLLFNIEKGDQVIIYHSLALIRIIKLLRKIKNFTLILEVEEIFNYVSQAGARKKKAEIEYIQKADKYIFSTQLLNARINLAGKPYILIYGTYKIEDDHAVTFDDDKIHLLYAGTLAPRKGASVAIASAEFLPENYHLHIIGFGSDSEINSIKLLINKISSKSDSTITYDGVLRGLDYIMFAQKCDIGLSTQSPEETFNDTAFPSKILSYMANGLRVVSAKIEAVETSPVGQNIFYYENQNIKSIAKTILNIDINNKYNSRELIAELDRKFCKELYEFITNEN